MEESIRERKKLNLWLRVILIIIICMGIFLPIIGIIKITSTIKNNNKKVIYSSTINRNSNYKVELYDNNYIDQKEMGADHIYISDLVKNIKFDLFYTYSATDKTDLNYSYDIKAKLCGENNNNATGEKDLIWEKDYTLMEEKNKSINNASGFNITENINIDFPKYNKEVSDFKRQFGINLDTYLKITMNIKYNGNYKDNKINKTDKVILEIPLGIQAFSIKENYDKKNTYNIYKNNNLLTLNNKLLISICIIIFIATSVLALLTYKAIFNIKPKSKYTKELDKILKSYGEIIVEVTTPVKTKNYNIINVKNIEEMIDLEEELRIPIILYESIYKHTATFTITYNKTIYKYILN